MSLAQREDGGRTKATGKMGHVDFLNWVPSTTQGPVALCFAEDFRDSGPSPFVCSPAPSPASELKTSCTRHANSNLVFFTSFLFDLSLYVPHARVSALFWVTQSLCVPHRNFHAGHFCQEIAIILRLNILGDLVPLLQTEQGSEPQLRACPPRT